MLLTAAVLAGKQDVKIEKNYNEVFLFKQNDRIEISNKYGEVIIRTWYKDSVRIKIRTVAVGKSQEVVNREMRRVDLEIRKIGSVVSGVTNFDRGRTGIFGDLISQVEDYSKSVVGGSKITVDYEVWIPEDANISIDNKFGNIYLADLKGEAEVNLSHGDLRANRIDHQLELFHSFGKNSFDFINEGNLVLRGADTRINKAKKLDFESSSSEINLGEVNYLDIDSRNDKFNIDEAREVVGKGSFTDLNLEYVIDNLRLDFNYGDVYLSRINRNFNTIALRGNSSDINIVLDQASYIKTYISGNEEKMILPNSMLVLSRENLSEENNISLSGFVGNTNTSYSNLEINAEGGELIIAIKETTLFTNKDE
jgi:hypothetical protein